VSWSASRTRTGRCDVVRRAAHKAFSRVAESRGYVRPTRAGYDADFVDLYERCREFTMTSIQRMDALHTAVRYVVRADIPGDVVECGVWRGGSSMLAAGTLKELGASRTVWLYDTFEGMTAPTYNDGAEALETWSQQGNRWCNADLEDVRRNMASIGYSHVRYVKGPVEHTIPGEIPERISLLRLDTDFYKSTQHELEHLWPRLSPGGVLVLDDYGRWEGQRRAVDEYFNRPLLLTRLDSPGRIAVKPALPSLA
jgi:O-methyltransferase